MIVTIDNIPVYDAIITDEETGMMKISLVDDPAVMSNFQAFDSNRKMMMYAIADEEKRIVRGVVMRADFPIYRRDNQMGEYYIIYKADTIRQMAEKYLVESRQNNVNLMHQDNSDVEGVQMVQYFIKDTEKGISPQGFEDIADGSLFAEFHIVNDDVWEAIKDGTYKGFSLEGYFDLVPEQDVEGVETIVDTLQGAFSKLFRHKNMSKLSKFKAALAKVFAEFGNITTDKGILAWDGDDDIKVGDNAYIEDEEGNRTPAESGEYKTDDGLVIVIEEGVVTDIHEAEVAEPEPEPEPTVDVNAKKQSFAKKVKEAFGESYDEKMSKIYDAILAAGYTSWSWLSEAGDDYAVLCYEDEETWEFKYLRFDVSWDAEGNAIVSNPVEVVEAFVPADTPSEPNPDPVDPAEPAPSAEEFASLKAENASLKAKLAKMSKTPAAKPAHEEVKASAQTTGIKGLDNLTKVLSAK